MKVLVATSGEGKKGKKGTHRELQKERVCRQLLYEQQYRRIEMQKPCQTWNTCPKENYEARSSGVLFEHTPMSLVYVSCRRTPVLHRLRLYLFFFCIDRHGRQVGIGLGPSATILLVALLYKHTRTHVFGAVAGEQNQVVVWISFTAGGEE